MVSRRALYRDENGSGAAEFALVLTPLLIVLFGMIDTGRYLWTVNEAEKATQVGARVAAVTTPLVQEISSTNYIGTTVGSTVLTQGDRIPAAALGLIRCTSAACTCVTAPCPATLTYDTTSVFTNSLLPRMQATLPGLTAANIVVEYRGSGNGFAGDPNGPQISPMVTVKLVENSGAATLAGMPLPVITSFMFASLRLPLVSTTLPAEDLSGSTSF
ncbi:MULTISPECIES: TadE/TadG family type IV pilus assembly protein [Sphingomonas]|uniref:TadE/TadG family type IV pilus assembly protein n=1 Tax=Sphingomonas TaxID=13687 RepID=UPI000DEF3BF5|nr:MULTISPECIES: TadE/TadG family type IV pilus assembly protein [Sphingomonas]